MLHLRDRGVDRMRTTEQINSFWELARERSIDGEILRRRVAAVGAITIVFCGFLLAIGLGILVLVFLGGMVASLGVAALLALWPRMRAGGGGAVRRLRKHVPRARGRVGPVAGRASTSAVAFAHAAAGWAAGFQRGLAQTARGAAIRFAPRPARLEPQREAIRLNAT